MVAMTLPRFVNAKRLASGRMAYFWNAPSHWRKQGCPYRSAALGAGLSQAELEAAAKGWNDGFDAWRLEQTSGETDSVPTGTVKWLVHTFLQSPAFHERVDEAYRGDYRLVLGKLVELPTERPDLWKTVGALHVSQISPAAADKIYSKMCADEKYRKGEKAVSYCKTAWSIVGRLHPEHFNAGELKNPWLGVTLKRRERLKKPAATRAEVYAFAWGAVEAGRPELAAAAVICFEWLQRPMNVIAGKIAWGDYRGAAHPGKVRIQHHKNRTYVEHPLEDVDGTPFYAEAEAVLAKLPRRGTMMILGPDGQRYKATRFAQLVRRTAGRLKLPDTFSLDACRHGGMTELEEAALTEGQGMALSGHKTASAFRKYPKETELRVLAATRRRTAYRLAG